MWEEVWEGGGILVWRQRRVRCEVLVWRQSTGSGCACGGYHAQVRVRACETAARRACWAALGLGRWSRAAVTSEWLRMADRD